MFTQELYRSNILSVSKPKTTIVCYLLYHKCYYKIMTEKKDKKNRNRSILSYVHHGNSVFLHTRKRNSNFLLLLNNQHLPLLLFVDIICCVR